jgi:hypothetical protein
MSDTEGKIWYRVSSGPRIEEVLVIKETAHRITELVDLGGRNTTRIHDKKSSHSQYVATPGEVRKIIEEMVADEKRWVTHSKERIARTEEKIAAMEQRLLAGSFPIIKLQTKDMSKPKTEELGL